LGVINIITKEAEDIDGFELTARGGSWDTQQYNLLFGKTFSDLEVAFNFNYFKTHGFRGLIEEDYQTQLDQLWPPFFPDASLAPGRMSGNDEKYDAQLTLKYKGFTFDGRYVDRERDLPVGWVAALNNKSINSTSNYALSFSYEKEIRQGLSLMGKVYGNYEENPLDMQIFPPGFITMTPTGPEIMPDGMLNYSSIKSSRIGIEIQATYNMSDSNTVVAGVTYEEMKQYDGTSKANYLPIPDPPRIITPLPSVQEWPDEYTRNSEKIDFKAVFVEDIWDITDNLRLTTGARYDRYSNFGSELSPRVGLTWEYIDGYDLKLLYGHAFRAPSFEELFSPQTGNRDLEPETIDSYEASLGADFSSSLSGRITGYYQKIKDIIVEDPPGVGIWINHGKRRVHGFEVEVKYDFGRGTYLAGNYNYGSIPQGSTPTGKLRNWSSPRHKGNIMANIRLSKYLNFFTNCHFEDDFPRQYGDNRDEMSGYAFVDATLIARKFLKGYEGLELRASVYNLFDKEYTSPQDTRLPNDMPMPGVNYLLEVKYGF
jgi:outer membrane receptor protein involved in Fe transport